LSDGMDDKSKPVGPPPGHEDSFFRVAKASSALGMGVMAAFLFCLKEVNPAVRFEFSVGALVAFALAAGLSWSFWNAVAGAAARNKSQARRFFALAALLGLGTLGAFAYALKDVPSDRASDVMDGVLIAFLFLGMLGLVFWRVVRFFEKG